MLKSARTAALALIFIGVMASRQGLADDDPWRLSAALGAPHWLTLEGSYRLRYEFLDNTFRVVDPGQDELLVSRLRLHAGATGERFYGGLEIQDSRGWLHSARTPLGTDDVNALEPIRAYLGYKTQSLDIQVGRMNWDMGSRRLLSRNRYRNVTNVFTGARVTWTTPGRFTFRSWFTMPAVALPNNLERARLRDNEFELDQERGDYIFWGADLDDLDLGGGVRSQWYLLGVREDDRPSRPTRNRDFLTVGLRLQWAGSNWDLELETAYQIGETRATASPADTTDIDHRAYIVHAEARRRLAGEWRPEVIFLYTFGSGDKDPNDGQFNRFDSLYGDRRFELGPTGIFGPLSRSNVNAPGLAIRLHPSARSDIWIDYRAAWLASDRDLMPTAGLRDPDGNSGSFIGHQVDGRWRWQVVPGLFSVEFGGAYLWKGEFLKSAPAAPPPADTVHLYAVTNLFF